MVHIQKKKKNLLARLVIDSDVSQEIFVPKKSQVILG